MSSVAELRKLLAKAEAEESKIVADPEVAKAQADIDEGHKRVERARKALKFAKMGATGGIKDENTREKTLLLMKALATTSSFLTKLSGEVQQKWMPPSKSSMLEFLAEVETLHNILRRYRVGAFV